MGTRTELYVFGLDPVGQFRRGEVKPVRCPRGNYSLELRVQLHVIELELDTRRWYLGKTGVETVMEGGQVEVRPVEAVVENLALRLGDIAVEVAANVRGEVVQFFPRLFDGLVHGLGEFETVVDAEYGGGGSADGAVRTEDAGAGAEVGS